MYEKMEKAKKNRSKGVTNSVSQKKWTGKQCFEFVDNRSRPFQPQLTFGKYMIKSNDVVQRLRAISDPELNRINLSSKSEDGKIIATTGRWDVGELSYEGIGNGVVSQNYINVDEKYKNAGISYVLIYFAAETWGDVDDGIVYLGGGSLSPSGVRVANQLSFSEYKPSGNPQKDNPKLLHAYNTQKKLAGGDIPPIKYKKISALKKIALQKAQQHGWSFQ